MAAVYYLSFSEGNSSSQGLSLFLDTKKKNGRTKKTYLSPTNQHTVNIHLNYKACCSVEVFPSFPWSLHLSCSLGSVPPEKLILVPF